jgi:hypothetical protein
MIPSDLFINDVFPRALVIGLFGRVGLALTARASRYGPAILPVYAAVVVVLGLLLARYSEMRFAVLFTAAFASYVVASLMLYVTVNQNANAARRRAGRNVRVPLLGHAWRLSLIVGSGAFVGLAVAFVAS